MKLPRPCPMGGLPDVGEHNDTPPEERKMTWRQSDEAIRTLLAREIWRYQQAGESFGDFDTVDDSDGMAALVKRLCIDEAEGIRKVILESAVLRARLVSPPMTAAGREEMVADAIDLARYQHPEHPRERPRPFSEADRSDREYATRLAKAALNALTPPPSSGDGKSFDKSARPPTTNQGE